MARPDHAGAGFTLRCAIYTRKSSDEGLDQEFNSLDAQLNRAYATPALQNFEICLRESCGSSVVEHSLGKGEAESSILSRSTIKTP
jgi:hypothetical protein